MDVYGLWGVICYFFCQTYQDFTLIPTHIQCNMFIHTSKGIARLSRKYYTQVSSSLCVCVCVCVKFTLVGNGGSRVNPRLGVESRFW